MNATATKAVVGVLTVAIVIVVTYLLAQLVGVLLALCFVIGLGMGVMFVPGLITLFGPSLPLKGVFGLGTMILAQLANGATYGYVRPGGKMELCRYDVENNRAKIEGEWVDLDEDPQLYRVGWRPFAIGWEKTPEAIKEYWIDRDDEDVKLESDDGTVLLEETKDGTPLFAPARDGVAVDVIAWIRDMGRNGNNLVNRTKEIAMRDYSGDRSLGELTMAIVMLGAFVISFALGYLMMGMF